MDISELLEAVNSPTPSIESIFEVLYDRRFTGQIPLVLHFRGGRVQVLEVMQSTQIRLRDSGRNGGGVDNRNGT